MKTAGIIGGFGPEAKVAFQLKMVELFRAQNQTHRPPILIWNTPIPLQIEEDLLLRSKGVRRFLPFLLEAAQKLEHAGADFIVLPCNTLHIFINEIRKSVKIPVLSIVEETADFLDTSGIEKIGLFASRQTIKDKLHEMKLRKFNIRVVIPSLSDQRKVDILINQIIADSSKKSSKDTLSKIAHKFLKKGIRDILLACTDLQLVFPKISGVHVHDTLHVLAMATVRELLN